MFDGKNYRTTKLNNLVKLIYLKANELQEIGKEKAGEITRLSSNAPPLVLSSNHLEESYSFHLLYEEILKDIKQPKLHKQ